MQSRNPFLMNPSENMPISRRMLTRLVYVAFVSSVYRLIVIDLSETGNAAWLTVLLGAIMALPALFSACALLRHPASVRSVIGKTPYRLLCGALAAVYTFEAAVAFSSLAESAAYAALYVVPGWALLIFTFITASVIAYRGGNSVGGVAAVWVWAAPALYALTAIPQLESINPNWLMPLLGPGWETLLRCACPVSLLFSLIPFSMLLDDRTRETHGKPGSLLRLFIFCAISVSFLCAVHASVYPSLPFLSNSRSMRLDLLLSGGKTNRAVQLPMLLLWYGSLITSAAFFVYAAGRFLCIAFGSDRSVYALGCGAVSYFLAYMGFADMRPTVCVSFWSAFAAVGAWILILCAYLFRRRMRK